jgi:hypothetical protein
MKFALALLMVLHGFAHLVGFAAPWRLAAQKLAYKTTVLSGHLDLGDTGIHAFGILWLLAALGFWVASAGAVAGASWWVSTALVVSVCSLILSVFDWPDARIGVAVNAVLVVLLLAGREMQWW